MDFFDFTNEVQFTRTRPVRCSIQGENIEGKTWSQILASIVNREIIRIRWFFMEFLKTNMKIHQKNGNAECVKENDVS